jgi:hypothetical protein
VPHVRQSVRGPKKMGEAQRPLFWCCEKTLFFEGYGLQPVHKRLKVGTALAAEGRTPTLFTPIPRKMQKARAIAWAFCVFSSELSTAKGSVLKPGYLPPAQPTALAWSVPLVP